MSAGFLLDTNVVSELRKGHRADAGVRAWFDDHHRVRRPHHPVTTEVCERWAMLDVPDPLPVIDGLLAATALERDLVFVTRNAVDVERTGVALVNPFDA
jgi:predicted nucleic acid-binding protein